MGVFDRQWVVPVAEALGKLGSIHAFVVHGEDGLDEISLTAPTFVAEWREGTVRTMTLAPQDFRFSPCTLAELQVKSAQESAAILRAVLPIPPARTAILLS